MSIASIKELLAALNQNVVDPDVVIWLEQTPADAIVAELKIHYTWTFQERRLKEKWEISLARQFLVEMPACVVGEAGLLSFRVVPTYRRCLMLSIEGNRITGISRFGKLQARVVRKPKPGLALRMSAGRKLDLLPDGWEVKSLDARTTRLPEALLRQRGWQFEHLRHLVPSP